MKTDAHWAKIGSHPHHGICLPLFSLRTNKSAAIGEFLDLLPLIDWCKSVNLDCLQLLPLNDTGNDPSPYNPLSSLALDPIYLTLSALPNADELPNLSGHTRAEAKAKKLDWLKTYFAKNFSNSPLYQAFVKQNPWLESYALFMTLREKFGPLLWSQWPKDYQTPHLAHAKEFEKELALHRFLQFLCFSQMKQVKAHATKQAIFLIGDLPILVSPNSADVWANQHLFDLTLSAGAPPDRYNTNGQNWGFPLLKPGNLPWYGQRLKTMEEFFHIYRIDHVVGLFRIWASPLNNPQAGSFYPPNPDLWETQGRETLTYFLQATTMLPIAEDLGTIPQIVYSTLETLGICGTKVVPWEKRDGAYVSLSHYPHFSVSTLGTHDMPSLETWWKNTPTEAAPFAAFMNLSYHPILASTQRLQILHAIHHSSSIFHINLLQEYLALFPNLVSPDERINIPGPILPTNWTYRFRPLLEEITSHQGLKDSFKKILN